MMDINVTALAVSGITGVVSAACTVAALRVEVRYLKELVTKAHARIDQLYEKMGELQKCVNVER